MGENPNGGDIAFVYVDAILRGMLHPRQMAPAVWGEGLSTGILVAVPSVLFWKTTSLRRDLAHFTLPLLNPLLSGCEQNFVCWPFNRALVPLANSCLFLTNWKPAAFHCQMLCRCLFLALMLWAEKPNLWVETPHFLGGTLRSWDIPQNLSSHLQERSQLFLHLHSSYQSRHGFFCNSLVMRLLFHWFLVGYSGWLFII